MRTSVDEMEAVDVAVLLVVVRLPVRSSPSARSTRR